MRGILRFVHWAGVILVVHAVMLAGADEISTLENGARTIRSFSQILTLYGLTPPQPASMPTVLDAMIALVMSAPGWVAFGIFGIVVMALTHQPATERLEDASAGDASSDAPPVEQTAGNA